MNLPPGTDPLIAHNVKTIRDRFGADGLRSLIALAQHELTQVEAAQQADQQDPADTAVWMAYRDSDA